MKLRRKLRIRAGSMVVDRLFRGLSNVGALHPRVRRPERYGIEVVRDLDYRPGNAEEHRLDVYRRPDLDGPRPIVFYVHGGGFRILSKDTHWMMGLRFARHGWLTFNVGYRLAPQHRYPAAIEDVCEAFTWVVENAARFGGDTSRIVLAGESAGANLVTSLALCNAVRRPEPWAARVFDLGVRPRAVAAVYGLLQVTDIARLQTPELHWFYHDRLEEVASAYLPPDADPTACELADPLLLIERGGPFTRPLPPFFVPVGTRDPVMPDSRRLAAALRKLGVECVDRYYEDEGHAFHVLLWKESSKACWKEMLAFVAEHGAPELLSQPPLPGVFESR